MHFIVPMYVRLGNFQSLKLSLALPFMVSLIQHS